MDEIGVRELKATLSGVLRRVSRGEHVRVTVRGVPVADILPAGASRGDEELRATDRSRPNCPSSASAAEARAAAGARRPVTFRAGAGRTRGRALILYLDASALVKRYVAEPGSDAIRSAMQEANGWFMCRVGFVETARAVGLVAGEPAVRRFTQEWPAFGVVEVDQDFAERAASARAVERGAQRRAAGRLLAGVVDVVEHQERRPRKRCANRFGAKATC
jgi:prevent-host-death family protein